MNYLIRLKDGQEEFIADAIMETKETVVIFTTEDTGKTIFPLINIILIKELETNKFKLTTTYIP